MDIVYTNRLKIFLQIFSSIIISSVVIINMTIPPNEKNWEGIICLWITTFISAFLLIRRFFPDYKTVGNFKFHDNIARFSFITGKRIELNCKEILKMNVNLSGIKNTGNRFFFDNGANNIIEFYYRNKWYSLRFLLRNKEDLKTLKNFLINIQNDRLRIYFSERFLEKEKNLFKAKKMHIVKASLLYKVSSKLNVACIDDHSAKYPAGARFVSRTSKNKKNR